MDENGTELTDDRVLAEEALLRRQHAQELAELRASLQPPPSLPAGPNLLAFSQLFSRCGRAC
jgi:hypothetical protein